MQLSHPFRATLRTLPRRSALAAAVLAISTVAGAGVARAWAPNTTISWRMAIKNGIWDSFDIAGPSYHHRPWGGDWATDLYGLPGSPIVFSISEDDRASTAGLAYGVIESNYSACQGADQAGIAYRVGVYDGDDQYIGWVLFAHVDTANTPLKAIGTVVPNGTRLGHTKRWAYSNCYQVTTDAGVHAHIEAYNNDDYSCYTPWSPGEVFTNRHDVMGTIGANATGVGQACW